MISQLKIGLSGKVYLLMYRGESERCWPSRAVQVHLSNFRHTAIMQNSSRDFFLFFNVPSFYRLCICQSMAHNTQHPRRTNLFYIKALP